jgi:hypothetical protein
MVIFSLSVLVPLPLTNSTPGVAIAIIGVGMIERDGLLVVLGTILGTVWIGLLVLLGGAFAAWLASLPALFG